MTIDSAERSFLERITAIQEQLAKHDGPRYERNSHPDDYYLNEWSEYGPRNWRVASLVVQIAYRSGMRLDELEQLLEELLAAVLAELPETGKAESSNSVEMGA